MKGVIIKSDYSNENYLELIEKDDGNIVIKTIIRDKSDRSVVISTSQGGGKLENGLEVRNHLRKIIELLSNGSESPDKVRIFGD